MTQILEKLKGKKTYVLIVVAMLASLGAWDKGEIELNAMIGNMVLGVLGLCLRKGLTDTSKTVTTLLQGKKTYIVSAVTIAGYVGAYLTDQASLQVTVEMITAVVIAIVFRTGITNTSRGYQ